MTARLGAFVVGAAVGVLASCYQVPAITGLYRCGDKGCPTDMVCHDGVCCRPGGSPECTGYVFDGGVCADGGVATTYYEDLDGDGFGNANRPRPYCRPPVFDTFVSRGGDCNDNPTGSGRLFFPDADEQCDGLDNDCDGVPDDGLTQKTYYLDQDRDGFGDPAVAVSACAPPVGYVSNAQDCGPASPTVSPLGVEVCNTVDDNCDGVKDNVPPSPCAVVPGAIGACRAGEKACTPTGAEFCKQTRFPNPAVLDVCNAEDDDCDGAADERPDCGGVSHFFEGGVTFGARHLSAAFTTPSKCLKDEAGAPPDDTYTPSTRTWTGVGSATHVLWAETDRLWDLSKTTATLRLRFSYAVTNAGSPPWAGHNQPIVLLCGPDGYARYRPDPDTLLRSVGGTVDTAIPLAGGSGQGWLRPAGPSGGTSDLRRINRIEVLIQPWPPAAGSPSFSVTLDDWGL